VIIAPFHPLPGSEDPLANRLVPSRTVPKRSRGAPSPRRLQHKHPLKELEQDLPFVLRHVEAGVGDEVGEWLVGQVVDKRRLMRSSYHEQIHLIRAPRLGTGAASRLLEHLGTGAWPSTAASHKKSGSTLGSV